MIRPILLEAVSGQAANALQSFSASIGYEYQALCFEMIAGTSAITDINRIDVFVNSVVAITLTGQQLDEYNKYDKRTAFATNSVLLIPFSMTDLKDSKLMEMTNLNTGVPSPNNPALYIDSLTVQITPTAGTPTWNAYGIVDDRSAVGPGVIKHIRNIVKSAATGDNRYTDVLKGADLSRMLARIFIKCDVSTISAVRLEADGKRVWQGSLNIMKQIETDGNHTPGAYWSAVVDFRATANGFGPDALPFLDLSPYVGQSVDIIVTNAGAATQNAMLLEFIGLPPKRG